MMALLGFLVTITCAANLVFYIRQRFWLGAVLVAPLAGISAFMTGTVL